jgi:hypothetical protein
MTNAPISRLIALPLAVLLLAAPVHGARTLAQSQPERFWLAGRYDGNRVIVYFDTVQFQGTIPTNAKKIAFPVVEGFFRPVVLSPSYVARFQKKPGAEHFAIGDRYDLLFGTGMVATMTLTSLVGSESDEFVGNDSFLGALGTVEKPDYLLWTKGYYAVRRHREADAVKRPRTAEDYRRYAHLSDEPVPFDTQTRIAELLTERMKTEATATERQDAADVAPAFHVQPFHVADGSLRYYVRAEWKSGRAKNNEAAYVLAAWMTTAPTLHIIAIERRTSPYSGINANLPVLLNVVDLGAGRTGLIAHTSGLDSVALTLVEYRDGASLRGMRALQAISVGE